MVVLSIFCETVPNGLASPCPASTSTSPNVGKRAPASGTRIEGIYLVGQRDESGAELRVSVLPGSPDVGSVHGGAVRTLRRGEGHRHQIVQLATRLIAPHRVEWSRVRGAQYGDGTV